jgi:hypothetical protein
VSAYTRGLYQKTSLYLYEVNNRLAQYQVDILCFIREVPTCTIQTGIYVNVLIMTIVRNSCVLYIFGFNSRVFLRHIGLFMQLPVGALTVSILGLYTDI